MQTRDITLNGRNFHLREWGDPGGPVILMLHGFPEYGGAWADIAAHLPGYRCLAPDQRGYGQSWAPQEVDAYKTRHMVADAAALVEAEAGGKPVIVFGHDWGAAVAYGLAIARPDLVSHLVIANGVHPGPYQRACAEGGAQTRAAQYIHALRDPGAEAHFSEDGFRRLMRLFGTDMDFSWMTEERAERYRAEWARPGRLTGMLNWYRASPIVLGAPGERLDVPPVPKDKFRVTMPHLLIWGMGDTALLPEATEGLEAWCDDLTRVEIEGADHWVLHQKPQEVAETVEDWLRR